jgi:hypothetical protein
MKRAQHISKNRTMAYSEFHLTFNKEIQLSQVKQLADL